VIGEPHRVFFHRPITLRLSNRSTNNLVQLISLTAGTLSATYNYPAGSNNGKITSSVINGETVTYQYDSLNRLIAATSSASWGEQYAFDGFGNLTTKTGSGAL
jgi:YD repeat-containing protein